MRSSAQIAAMFVAAAIGSPVAAVTLGETDTFSSSSEGWFIGGGPGGFPATALTVAPTGGPSGAGDAYLQLTSTGSSGPGSRLVANNATQWTGNYIGAGVTAIEMDLNNFGTTDLTIRLLFEDPGVGPPTNIAATTFGAPLPAASGWTHVRFSIAPGDLTTVAGNVTAALSGATFFRLFHNTAPEFPPLLGPPPIAAILGVDNISAVPEPSAAVIMLLGLGAIGMAVRRKRAR
ncbi:MAG: PEP-CTERM sorting domain-containing protein [Betaproteobacteria bacterium]|nr:PEP-CTERM sorting domain-containing protein [Betaproteobacteria bacterium]